MNGPNDIDPTERLSSIYASKERLQEIVRAMEARVARSIRTISMAGALLEDVELLRELERNLEWFFTWRLKLAETSAVMGCDGVIDLAIHSRGDLSFEIEAKAYIGPESEANTTLCAFGGILELDEDAHRLRGYSLNFVYQDEPLIITEAI